MRNFKSRIPIAPGKFTFEQTDEMREFGERLIGEIAGRWCPPSYFFHFHSGGHLSALRHHESDLWFASLDLARFFEQVTRHRIVKRLKSIHYSFEEAEEIAVASTILFWRPRKRFALPYGFVQSPMLAALDLAFSALGQTIELLQGSNVRVSVYVDDIIISGENQNDVESALVQLKEASDKAKYLLNENKCSGPSQSIEVFNILMKQNHLEICHERLMKFKNDIQYAGYGPESDAILRYVDAVNCNQARDLSRFLS